MNDLEKLQAALRDASPAPDADAKAEALRMAAENFARIQESQSAARPMSEAPTSGSLWKRTTAMFTFSNLRPVLYATSCLVVAGAVFVAYDPLRDGTPTLYDAELTADEITLSEPEPAIMMEVEESVPTNRLRTEPKAEIAITPRSATKAARADGISETRTTSNTQSVPKDQDSSSGVTLKGSGRLGMVYQAEQDVLAQKPSNNDGSSQSENALSFPKNRQLRSQEAAPKGQWMGNDMFSITDPTDDAIIAPQPNNDQFTAAPENPVKVTAESPVSTFSIDVDTASYTYVRSTLLNGGRLNPNAVRIEEMINYFPYDYTAPAATSDVPFSTDISVTKTPWNADTNLVRIAIQGKKPAIEDRPPLNLVFLIDTSGSMQDANKLPLLKQSFALMLTELRPTDQVAIVTYAGSAGTVLEPTNAGDTATILNALDALNAGGSTAGGAGLRAAYALADQMKAEGEISRVLLATDGDFNVGINNPNDLKTAIEKNRDSGTYLSVLGFGRGNYRDDMMQTLAQNGNGTAAYIDTLAEAQKTLDDKLPGALFPIAKEVKIQVEFNPATIAEYRLIGYETRALNRENFNNDAVDAGDIGAGHQVTALYEVTPVGSPAILNDPLRYAANTAASDSSELGFFKLRYKTPGAAESQLITTPISRSDTPANAGFAAAIAGFGQLLKGSKYTNSWTLDDAITLASETKGTDPYGYRAQAIRLMKLAKARK